MNNIEGNNLSGEWVGYVGESVRREFVRISFSEGWCDLPQRKLFNLEFTWDEGEEAFQIGDIISFSGRVEEPVITGRFEGGGEIRLWRVIETEAANPNRTIGGAYRLPTGESLHIFAQTKSDESSWQTYARQGRRLDRLYPTGEGLFVSEMGAFYEFEADGLTIKPFSGEVIHAAQSLLFHRERLEIPTQQGHSLVGALLTPLSDGPHPLVIQVHGAGPGYCDDYLDFAGFFLERGIAAFIYDKRGWGESGGEEVWSDVFKLADDAEQVIRFLKSHPSVQAERIGLCGFSNGGWVGPLAASRFDDIAFVISFSGSGVSPARQEGIRRRTVAREVLGASEEQAALLELFWEHAFKFLARGEWSEDFERLLHRIDHDPDLQALPKHAGMPDGLQPVPPLRSREEWDELGGGSEDMLFDPVPVFAGLSSPLLFVWGEEDSLVPVDESAEAVAEVVRTHQGSKILRFPQAGHQLFVFDSGIMYARPLGDEISRFRRIPRCYVAGVWEGIMNWTMERL